MTSAAAVLASAVLLTGCVSAQIPEEEAGNKMGTPATSSPAEEGQSGLDAEPATGETFAGDGYSLTAPEGWTQGEPPEAVDIIVGDAADDDGFRDNLNVVLSPQGLVSADMMEQRGPDELESAGATEVVVGERLAVAGSESAHLSAEMAQQGVEYVIDQYTISDDAQTYIVTFSFSPDVSEGDRAALAESVLVTWAWS